MVVGSLPERARHYQHRAVFDRLSDAAAEVPTVVLGQVLTGMGGVGKTQLAAEYAHRLLDGSAVDAVVWVEAGSRTSVVSTYAQAARAVGADASATDPDDQAAAFLSWLRTTPKRWLVVLDDAAPPSGDDDAPLGLEYLDGLWPPETTTPRKGTGRALVTTRRKDAALASGNRVVIDVDVFTLDEAVAFFTGSLSEHGIETPEDDAAALAADLGYLPLALAQAAAFIADEQTDCAAYRRLLADEKRRLDQLVPGHGSLPIGHAQTVAATLALSIDHANRLPPTGWARPLMQVMGLLSPEAIPVSVLTASPVLVHLRNATGHPSVDPEKSDAEAAQEAVRRSLGVLRRLSLITTGPLTTEGTTLGVHALTQRAARESLTPTQQTKTGRAAADALAAAWPAVERDTALCLALRSCTTALTHHATDALWSPDPHSVLFRVGNSLGESGQVTAAVEHWKHLLTAAGQRLGPAHPHTLTTRHNLAHWTGQAGDPAEARRLSNELLNHLPRVLGPHHPHTLATRHNLASWTGQAGNPAEAARQCAEVLNDVLRVLGPDHPNTLTARSSLAYWTGHAGDPAEAARLYTELLNDRLRVLGSHHPHTLATRHNLASWTGEAGNPAEARRLSIEVLEDYLRVLGPDHPNTLTIRNNIAYWTGGVGDPAEAARLYTELLNDLLRVLSPDHPDTLATRMNLEYWRQKADEDGRQE